MDEQEALRRLGRLLDPPDMDRGRGPAWERIRGLARDEARGVPLESTLDRDAADQRIRRAAERGLESRDAWVRERGVDPDRSEEWFGRGGRDEPGIDR